MTDPIFGYQLTERDMIQTFLYEGLISMYEVLRFEHGSLTFEQLCRIAESRTDKYGNAGC